MENQVTQLKLNVTNIKNSLFSSNKQLKKLKSDKKNLFFKLEKKKELRAEETRLETPRLGIGSGFSKIMSAVTSPVRSIFDRILDFIGLIAAGILINNLPSIIKKIQDFFDDDFIKGVGNVLGIIGNGILGLAKFVGIFPKSEQNKIEKNIKETDKRFDEDIKDADAAEKDIVNLEKNIVNLETNLGENETDTETDETLIRPVESDSSIPQSISEPSPKETSSTSTTESNTNPLMPSKPAQSFNSGGTVRSEGPSQTPSLAQKQTYTPQKSGVSKKVQRDANDGFTKFPIAVDNIHKSTKEQEKNIIAFSKMLKDSRGLDTKSSTSTNPPATPPATPPSSTTSGLPAIKIEPNEVIGTVGYTGYTVPKGPGGSHIHIENMNNYAAGIPAGVKNSILVNGSPMPSALQFTSGIGERWGKTHKGEDYAGNPNQPISLIGGLKFKQFISDSGDGYGNRVLIEAPDGTIYSLNHLNAGPTNINALIKKQTQKNGMGPYSKGGSDYRLNRSMNNQSVFIYAIQPQETFVPFPYPMPIETPAPSSSSTPQLSAIWRT